MKILTTSVALLAMAAGAAAQDQQLGGRTKAMGGSYTAFEDDPVSVWLNPAGIATQPDQLAASYQSYTAYPRGQQRGPGDTINFTVKASMILGDPALLPSFIGFVFQLGDSASPLALGVCYARPYILDYALDQIKDPNQTVFTPEAEVHEDLGRFRVAAAKDFRLQDPGTPGWFTHISGGLGLDVGYETWSFTGLGEDSSNSSSGVGAGGGALVGLYDNYADFKVNIGVAYSTAVHYNLQINPNILPAFDMPQQLNMGMTFYVLQGTPLRATIDAQWIDWKHTAQEPLYEQFKGFRDAINASMGVEYRIRITDTISLYPRAGYRRFEAPWSSPTNLPMTGGFRLVLDTKSSTFNLATYGVGIAWVTDSGKVRSIDLAGDAGGDATNFAVGLTLEF